MPLGPLLHHYGLAALFLGAGIEGEAVAVTGGILARKGDFPLAAAMAAAAAGSFMVDQIWFHLGRHFAHHRFVARFTERPAFARALHFIEHHPIAFCFAFRFIYGMRTVSPIAIGASEVPTRLFVIVNAIAAAVWGIVFIALGYAAGRKVLALLHRYQPSTLTVALVIGVILLAAALVHGIRLWRLRR
jgi:membrane protein DedA with SNARE-associated domain